jgi:hypothetical protein
MARVGEESASAREKRAQGCGGYDGGGDSDGRKKRMSVVNPDLWHTIYKGVHRVRQLWLLPPYDAYLKDPNNEPERGE